jgi:hypothetical protein
MQFDFWPTAFELQVGLAVMCTHTLPPCLRQTGQGWDLEPTTAPSVLLINRTRQSVTRVDSMYTTNNGSAPANGAAASSDSFGAYTYPRTRNDAGGSITQPQGMMAADAFANPEFNPAGVWPAEKTAEVPTSDVRPPVCATAE